MFSSNYGRCEYVWPPDFDTNKFNSPGGQSCCYRESLSDTTRCAWHADPTETNEKSLQTLSDSRTPPKIRRLNSNCDERLDGAILHGMDLAISQKTDVLSLFGPDIDGFDFSNCSLRDADFSETTLGMRDFKRANLAETNFSGANCQHAQFESATIRMANFRETEIWESTFRDA